MKTTLTFIGNGNMALSIAQGLKDDYEIEVVGRNMAKLDAFEEALGCSVKKSMLNTFDVQGKTIMLCVKPYNVQEVGSQLVGEAKVLYSVLAGTTLETLSSNIKTEAVVRAMPNLAATVKRSMTTLTGDIAYQKEAESLFGAIGPVKNYDSHPFPWGSHEDRFQ